MMKYCNLKNFTLFLGAFILILGIMVADAFGGSYYIPWPVPDYDAWAAHDTLRVIAYDANDHGTIVCSIATTTFPCTDSLGPLDSTKAYIIFEYRGYADFDSMSLYPPLHISPIVVSAEASINYDSINYYLETIYSHGAGAWTPSGTGDKSITVFAYRTSDSTPIGGATIAAYNIAQSVLQALGTTDTDSGKATMNVDSGLAVLVGSLTGYTWPTYDTHTVGDGASDTIWGTWYTPDASGSANLCAVYGYIRNVNGVGVPDVEVRFTLPGLFRNICDSTRLPYPDSYGYTNDSGYFTVPLVYSSCWESPEPNDTVKYRVIIGDAADTDDWIIVPDSIAYRVIWE